jgi:hypothetical protein
LWVIFGLLDPDPDPHSNPDPATQINADPDADPDPDPDPKPCRRVVTILIRRREGRTETGERGIEGEELERWGLKGLFFVYPNPRNNQISQCHCSCMVEYRKPITLPGIF